MGLDLQFVALLCATEQPMKWECIAAMKTLEEPVFFVGRR